MCRMQSHLSTFVGFSMCRPGLDGPYAIRMCMQGYGHICKDTHAHILPTYFALTVGNMIYLPGVQAN